ncbi:hypothetical protein [Mycoplasmopsis edwardii]|uniref:Uncharacterized protein n=1 Tax=Mycoplasmopsis edwardii TaxID=53558 RepID=A0ACD4PKA1_9BACT|nr:hypothetical protein [Mycoplasmopsis edwardii]WBP84319.1 hypothetical protein Me_995_000299 [Mycoplasmopsis edwardii]
MKKLLWSLSSFIAAPIVFVTSCSNEKQEVKGKDENLEQDTNVKMVLKAFDIADFNVTVNQNNLKWSEFKDEFNKLDISSPSYNKEFQKLLQKNWALLIANAKLFNVAQIPNNKWYLHPESENAAYNPLYKHSIGLVKIQDEKAVQHAHITFPSTVKVFTLASGVSKPFTSEKDGNKSVYVSFNKMLFRLYLVDRKINVDSEILYFLNATNVTPRAISSEQDFLIIQRYINPKPSDITQTLLTEFTDKFIYEIGVPARAYLKLK